ncbi:MAG: DUF262 domain-containing protein [Elusimicrobia bacterium]|jgi:uncharacterized protein with ParB-like and HNH nuclease domain|nr:DUF262 domain-containing protein [Elusimicrobiota bacterium]
MKAEAKSFNFLSLEGMVKIPFFQRTYVWDKDNWENLLSELLNKPSGHFLGSIILKQLLSPSGEPKQLEVIDGQQRLTTLSILLKALYDTFPSEIQKNCEKNIKDILFYREDCTGQNYAIKIEHSQVDADVYQNIIEANIDNNPTINQITENSHKMLQCYQYFYDELKNKSDEIKKSLLNKILNSENKMLVVIDLVEESDDEQAIFDTLNTAGVRLSPAEIIKNALFQRIIQKSSKKTAIDLYKQTWEKIFLQDEDTIKYWDNERQTGRFKRDNIEILLHCFAIIKGFYDPDKHALSDLSKLYKAEIANRDSKEKLEELLNEIIEYAKVYQEKIITFDKSMLFPFNDDIKRLLHILEVLEISTFHPFILFVFKKYQDESRKNIFLNLEKFIVRRMIAQKETKNYNKDCKTFIKNPDAILNKIETTDEEISNGIRKISNKNAALLLFWIELYRRNRNERYDIKELKYTYSLEHIMPQKWEEYWKDIPQKTNPDGLPMTEEETKRDRSNKIYWIGNMTLLTSSLNSALHNYAFEKKMNGEGRKKGIKAYAELSITKEDIVEPYDKGDRNWDEEKIIKRTNNLEQEIMKIWNLQG